jgi:hypothetical protein
MSCGGGHLGFPIGIKNKNFVEGLPMIIPGCSLDGPLQSLGFLFRYKMEDGGYSRTYFNIGPYGKGVSKRFLSETTHSCRVWR